METKFNECNILIAARQTKKAHLQLTNGLFGSYSSAAN
jgi:hypothetical protein